MKKVFQPPRLGDTWDGHKVFVEDDGRVVLADGSGDTPEQTEDGPLVVDASKPITISLSFGNVSGTIPVIVTRTGESSSVSTTLKTVKAVVEYSNSLVVCTPRLNGILGDLVDLTNRKPAPGGVSSQTEKLTQKDVCWAEVNKVIEKEGPGTAIQIEYEELAGSYGDKPNDPVWVEFAHNLVEAQFMPEPL